MDEKEEWITLCDQTFHSCFEDITEVTTSFCPMSFDKTIYHIYLILDEDSNNREEIKACAKVLNINYLKAREKIESQTVFAYKRGSRYDTGSAGEIICF